MTKTGYTTIQLNILGAGCASCVGKIEKAINSMKEITPRNIFHLIDRIKSIVDVDYILYFEKHQIMENFLTLKYDSRQPNKMQDKVFERS